MSQHDMTVDNGPGLTVRNDINSALQALASSSSGASAPSPSFPCQLWADTGAGRLKRRNAANNAWLDEGPLDAALRDAASQGEFVADTGIANAYTCNFVPAITARSESTPLRFKAANANSGASTINDGVGTVALVGSSHAALQGGEIITNGIAWIQWNGSIGGSGAYVLLFCTGATGPTVNQVQTAFTTAGTAPAFTLTPVPALGGYASPQRFNVKFNAAAATGGTLNISGLGAKNLKQYDSSGAKVTAVIAAGQITDVVYDGTDLVVLDPLPSAASDIWLYQPIGVPIPLLDNITGVSAPSTSSPYYRYIKLTAADSYNTGVLTSESVTGSAPLVQATATIALSGSPVNGQSVRLINTEERVLRAGVAGTVLQDAIQDHNHTSGAPATSNTIGVAGGGVGVSGVGSTTGGATNGRVATETRAKSLGVTYYLRIK
jgi:hypothetical protein